MVVSADISSDRSAMGESRGSGRLAHLTKLILILFIASAFLASPADAKKRAKRSHYAPPQSSMVVDVYSGRVLHTRNSDAPRFPASITKVMTLYMLFEQLDKGRLTLNSKLNVSAYAAARPPSKLGLKAGSTIAVGDAAYALVTKSANDVATVIAENIAGSEEAFARMMTQKARAIGMSKTTFRNASGLPDAKQVTTARDLITLGLRILKDYPEASKIFRTRYFTYGNKKYRNHNRLLFSYSGMEGLKTGFTRASGFNLLASCRRNDKHLVAVVLGGRSSRDRNAQMQRLLNGSWGKAAAFNELKQRGLDKPAALAGVLRPDMMPERNPAFHPTVSERTLQIAIVKARKSKGESTATAERPQFALAAAMAETAVSATDAAEPEQEEGDTEAERTDNADGLGPYHVQVGSFLDSRQAKARLAKVVETASDLLDGHDELTVSGDVRGKAHYRARFGKFSRKDAARTCAKLKGLSIECLVVRVE